MFTGIVEGTGRVTRVVKGAKGCRLFVHPRFSVNGTRLGDSLSVDGCCLTLSQKKGGELGFDVSGETLKRTSFRNYKKGSLVNLERPLKPTGRLGGHFVLGHVDGVGKVRSIKKKKGFLEMDIACPKQVGRYVINKGSIAVNGISLTATVLGKNRFRVFIIPHTLKATNLGFKRVDDFVNLEGDVLGKYLECLLSENRSYRTYTTY